MTARYSYAIAAGHDQSTLTNFEDIFLNSGGVNPIAPVGEPIPLGSVRRTTLDQAVHTSGEKVVHHTVKALSFADFERFILFVFGNWTTESANVTLDTRDRDELYKRGNAVAMLPLPGVDYQRREYGAVEDLVITYRDFQEAGSEFTTEFTMEFTA